MGVGARLVRDNLLQQQTGIRPERPRKRRLSRVARRFVARSRPGTGPRVCSLHPEAQCSEHGGRVPVCAGTSRVTFQALPWSFTMMASVSYSRDGQATVEDLFAVWPLAQQSAPEPRNVLVRQ